MSLEQRELRANITAALADRGRSRRELAAALGMSRSHVHNRMNHQWWSREEVEVAAAWFDMTVDELMGESLFKDDVHREARRQARAEAAGNTVEQVRNEVEETTTCRALCCECGTLRRIARRGKRLTVADDDTFRGRMLGTWVCATCGRQTEHAVLRDGDGEYADIAEQRMPSAEQTAKIALDQLWRRVSDFGVDVRYFEPNVKRAVSRGWPTMVRVEFDESKSQWRVELNRNVPAPLLLDALKTSWYAIAIDGLVSDYWSGHDVTNGVSMGWGTGAINEAIESLIDEVNEAAPAEKLKIIEAARDADEGASR